MAAIASREHQRQRDEGRPADRREASSCAWNWPPSANSRCGPAALGHTATGGSGSVPPVRDLGQRSFGRPHLRRRWTRSAAPPRPVSRATCCWSLNDRDAAASVSSAILVERPDTLQNELWPSRWQRVSWVEARRPCQQSRHPRPSCRLMMQVVGLGRVLRPARPRSQPREARWPVPPPSRAQPRRASGCIPRTAPAADAGRRTARSDWP